MYDDVLVKFLETQYDKIRSIRVPISFTNTLSIWVDKRSALNDLHVLEELNSIIHSIDSSNRSGIKTMDVDKYRKRIIACTSQYKTSERGIPFVIDYHAELSGILQEINNEFHVKRGKLARQLEKKINMMRPMIPG